MPWHLLYSQSLQHNKSSAVDLTIEGSNLFLQSSWQVVKDCGNSDRFPILLKINTYHSQEINKAHIKNNKIRNFLKTNWYSSYTNVTIGMRNIPNIISLTNKAAGEAIPYKNVEHKVNLIITGEMIN